MKKKQKTDSPVLNAENIGNRKIYVLDTNVLIHNPESLFNFENNVVVIPIVVIEEIDNFKKGLDEKGRNARQIGRHLDKIRMDGSLKDGIPINVREDKQLPEDEKYGFLVVEMSHKIQETMSQYYFKNENDNLIIGTAIHFRDRFPNQKVVLISKDANVRIKANAVGIFAENYENETVKFEELYTGVCELQVSDKEYNQFKKSQYLAFNSENLYPNQFIRLFNKEDLAQPYLLGRYNCSDNGNIIFPLASYPDITKNVFGIQALNEEQQFAFDLLLDENIKLVSLIGKAGTGKTLLAIAAGLNQVVESDTQRYSRLVISRPISPLGKDIGFLPGSKADKFNPWM
nr:PhoH family protein [Candidatus Cloacimonadota bacterium]